MLCCGGVNDWRLGNDDLKSILDTIRRLVQNFNQENDKEMNNWPPFLMNNCIVKNVLKNATKPKTVHI